MLCFAPSSRSTLRMQRFVFMFNVLGTNWGPTDRVLFMQIQLVKLLLLWEKQLLLKLPHAFGSYLAKKSDTDVVC